MIEGMELLTRMDVDVLMAFAKCDMRVCKASRDTFYHRNTFEWHLARIRSKTGLNPKKFYDLIKLVNAVEEMERNGVTPR